jgi:signal transduction histidine kinase
MKQDLSPVQQHRPGSLRGMLVLFALATTLLAWLVGFAMTATTADREASELHDRELKQIAVILLGMSAHELAEIGPDATVSDRIRNGRVDNEAALHDDYRYQVWSAQGLLLMANFWPASSAAMVPFGETGYSWFKMDGETWRLYAVHSAEGQLSFQVAERATHRAWAWPTVGFGHVALLFVTFAVVLGGAQAFLHHVLRPLRSMTAALEGRSPTKLEPVEIGAVHPDAGAVVAAINALMHRFGDALRRERQVTALAAHELRTPLATLRVLAEVVRNSADPSQSAREVDALIASADRCAHLQSQLLTLSRLETSEALEPRDPIDLTESVMEVISDVLPQARQREVRLVTRLDGSAMMGHRFGVMTLLRNLVANAVRYSPPGGRVEVVTQTLGSDVLVVVDDSGPGIPPAERARVFCRFVRLGHGDADGVGLGLSIVRAVVNAHGATCELSNSPLGGLRVTTTFKGIAAGEEAERCRVPAHAHPGAAVIATGGYEQAPG